jgi:DNA polymerase-1
MRERLFLLDAYALVYRAFYAFAGNPRLTSTGMNTSAAFGFTNFLLEMLERERPTLVAVVFDPPGGTFRHAMFPAYKAHRPPMPDDLRRCLPYIDRIVDALGIRRLQVAGFEADDVVGTLARAGEAEGLDVFMITPDKDYAQLVSEHVFMCKPGRGGADGELLDVDGVRKMFGVERVEQVVDILGLMGDTADNVPGCVGIGPKGAAVLVGRYGDIDGVYRHVEELKGKQRENLLACRDTVYLSRDLVRIRVDVPVGVTARELSRAPVDGKALEEIFRELEMFSLARRVQRLAGEEAGAPVEVPREEVVTVTCREVSGEAALRELARRVEAAPVFAARACFAGGTVHDALPALVAFSVDGKEAWFTRLAGDRAAALGLFRGALQDEGKTLVSDDVKGLLEWTRGAGIETRCRLFDTRVAHYVLAPDDGHELERVALEQLDYRLGGATPAAAASPQLSLAFDEEPATGAGEGATLAEGTGVVFRLRERLTGELRRVGGLALFEEVEMPLARVLADMEHEGVAVDEGVLHELATALRERLEKVERQVHEAAGQVFNVNSPRQLGEVLFDTLKIDGGKRRTRTGQASTSEQVLSRLVGEHPVVGLVLEYRGTRKLLTTYAEALPGYVNRATGRIHTCFNQAEAATGRLSSLNPNLQNIPARTEEGRAIRRAFVTGDPDFLVLSADYSQVELRLMAHLSGAPGLVEAFRREEDVHAATAAKIFHVPLDGVTPEMRRRAKMANFGIIYGISAWGLAERLGIPRNEGKELIEGYFQLYPGVRAYMDRVVEDAREKGYVETIMGRRRYLRDILSRDAVARGMAERNAINTPVQGSAADIIKKAMVEIQREMKALGTRSRMVLQVHDELVFSCHRAELDALRELVTRCMEGVVPLSVPLSVCTGHGENWYEAH